MREIPILFSMPMVRAIQDERKSMTRRIVKPQPDKEISQMVGWQSWLKCPYGQPGDRLWVRETTWISECKKYIAQGLERGHSSALDIVALETGKRYIWQHDISDYAPTDGMMILWSWQGRYLRSGRQTEEFDVEFADVDTTAKIVPFSDNIILKKYNAQFRKKLPSIFMPKAAARIWLEITNVRVERLQEITEEDARAEGFVDSWDITNNRLFCTARENFEGLWNTLNLKRGYGWEANPWVWVIEFKKVTSCD